MKIIHILVVAILVMLVIQTVLLETPHETDYTTEGYSVCESCGEGIEDSELEKAIMGSGLCCHSCNVLSLILPLYIIISVVMATVACKKILKNKEADKESNDILINLCVAFSIMFLLFVMAITYL